MYKLAQLKEAEVRGVVAALIDNGVLAIDSAEQFEKTASDASALLEGYDYDINDVANAAAYSLQKQAEEAEGNALNDQVTAALGELTLSKMAGEIDENTFNYYADAIVKQAAEDDKKKSSETRLGKAISGTAGGYLGAKAGATLALNNPAEQKMRKQIERMSEEKAKAVLKRGLESGLISNKKFYTAMAKNTGKVVGGLAAGIAAGKGLYSAGHKALDAYKGRFKDNNK